MGVGKSRVDDLNRERGIVSGRVAVLLRSTEVKPLFKRFVLRNTIFLVHENGGLLGGT